MNFDFETAIGDVLEKLSGWFESFVLMLPNVVVAVLVMVTFGILARFARKGASRLMKRATSYKQVNRLASTIAYLVVLSLGLFVALSVLDLNRAVTSLLAGAGIIGLALGFAFQDIAANFVSGILIAVRRPFQIGEIVETNDYTGVIKHIDLRSTVLRTFDGNEVTIPNKEVFQNPVVNYSRTQSRRVDIACGVSYADDLEEVERTAIEAVKDLKVRNQDKPIQLYYDEFGGSSINFSLRFWIDFSEQTDFLYARSQAIKSLKKAFDDKSITIPFPIRTLDFGIEGGKTIGEVLEMVPASAPSEKNGAIG